MLDKVISKIELLPVDNSRLINLCGRFDEHLNLIEKHFDVLINMRGNQIKIKGEGKQVNAAEAFILDLYDKETQKNKDITPEIVKNRLNTKKQSSSESEKNNNELDTKKIKLNPIKKVNKLVARSENQSKYLNNIADNVINFGIGPAGTGKTFLAVAMATQALLAQKVNRIVLVRPAVEAGERLGFLPGDLAQKIDPYLRPLYDALFEILGADKVASLIQSQVIEIAPLAYMRGRTLTNAFVILDESQNTTIEQMQMFLTRIGFSTKVVITGDVTQVDLPKGYKSGLKHAIDILKAIPDISFTFFSAKDIVRHPVVQKIVDAYKQD